MVVCMKLANYIYISNNIYAIINTYINALNPTFSEFGTLYLSRAIVQTNYIFY